MPVMGRQRGAVAVEVVLLVPMLVVVLGLVVGGWRLWSARTSVTQSAASAARAASLATAGAEARERATGVARANLATLGVRCDDLDIVVEAQDFARPPGQPGLVRVELRCAVALGDLVVPGMPGRWTVTGAATEVLDTYRERRP